MTALTREGSRALSRWLARSLGEPEQGHELTLPGGERFRVRPIRPADEAALRTFFERLSPEEIRLRFFTHIRCFSERITTPLSHLRNVERLGLIAIPLDGGPERIVAHALLAPEPDHVHAEFALLVAREYTRHGLGRHLLEHLIEHARRIGVRQVFGLVLRENTRMIDLAAELGFQRRPDPDEPECLRVERPTGRH